MVLLIILEATYIDWIHKPNSQSNRLVCLMECCSCTLGFASLSVYIKVCFLSLMVCGVVYSRVAMLVAVYHNLD